MICVCRDQIDILMHGEIYVATVRCNLDMSRGITRLGAVQSMQEYQVFSKTRLQQTTRVLPNHHLYSPA